VIEPGEECPAGGVAVHVGTDDDGDGTLDDEEIEQTTVVCDPDEIWEGDLTITDLDPETAERLAGVRVVTGSVFVLTNDRVDMPALELIGGHLGMGLLYTPDVHMSAVRQIVGDVALVAGLVEVSALESVGGDVDYYDGVLSARALREVGGELYVDTGEVTELAWPLLERVGLDLRVHAAPLTSLSLPALSEVGGRLWINSAALTTLDLGVYRVGGELSIYGTQLASIGLTIGHAEGGVEIFDNPALTSIQLPGLTTAFTLSIGTNPQLESVSIPQLTTASYINIDGNPITTLDLRGLVGVDRHIDLRNMQVTDLTGLSSLRQAGSVALSDMDQLVDLSGLGDLSWVWNLRLRRNDRLETLDGMSWQLDRIGGDLLLEDNPALRNLEGLDIVDYVGNLFVFGNVAMTSLDGLEWLTAIGGELDVSFNNNLASIAALAALRAVAGTVNFEFNAIPQADIDELLARIGH
jgi:hypothetical protein